MTEPSQEASNRKIFDLDTLVKILTILASVFYIIGFFTTNLYLQQFGFSDFSPINPRFILTGGLFVASIILINLIGAFLILLIWQSLKIDGFKSTIPLLLCALILILVNFIVPYIFIVKEYYKTLANRQLITISAYLYVNGLILGLIPLVWMLTIFDRSKITTKSKNKVKAPSKIIVLTIVILIYFSCSLSYFELFIKYIYPKVTEQYGGGEPRKVRIQFAKAQADKMQKDGIPTCSSGNISSNWSKPVSLLFEGSEKYLLQLEEKRPPIQLYKRNVDGVEPILEMYNQKQTVTECPYTYTEKNVKKPN